MSSHLFLRCVNRVLSHEGGYSDNPSDPGGKTMFGITERTARRNGYTGEMRFLPRETAIAIYEAEYWTPIRGDELSPALAFPLFDCAVNSGPPLAIKLLQTSLGVLSDGIFGPKTLAALDAAEPLSLGLKVITARQEFQMSLPTWPVFGKGWTRRNFKNLSYLLEDSNAA